ERYISVERINFSKPYFHKLMVNGLIGAIYQCIILPFVYKLRIRVEGYRTPVHQRHYRSIGYTVKEVHGFLSPNGIIIPEYVLVGFVNAVIRTNSGTACPFPSPTRNGCDSAFTGRYIKNGQFKAILGRPAAPLAHHLALIEGLVGPIWIQARFYQQVVYRRIESERSLILQNKIRI